MKNCDPVEHMRPGPVFACAMRYIYTYITTYLTLLSARERQFKPVRFLRQDPVECSGATDIILSPPFCLPLKKKIFRGRFFVGVYIRWPNWQRYGALRGRGGSKERQTDKALVINGIRSFPTVTLFLSIPSHCTHVAQSDLLCFG